MKLVSQQDKHQPLLQICDKQLSQRKYEHENLLSYPVTLKTSNHDLKSLLNIYT